MPGIFYTQQLTKSSRPPQGSLWHTVEAYFPETQVFATIALSSYSTQNDAQFASFQPRFTRAYIVVGTPSIFAPVRNTVYLRTGHLTFKLQVENATTDAVFSIYDTTPAADFELAEAENRLDLAVFDEVGNVVDLHSTVQLPGGAEIYPDRVREQVLAEARAGAEERTLDVAVIDPDDIPDGGDFRIDPSTRKPIPSA